MLAYWYFVPQSESKQDYGSIKLHKKNPYNEDHFSEFGYVDLPIGRTHFYFLGPENGKKLVIFEDFLNHLASKGFRILTFDLYGRGYSSTPKGVYNQDFYVNQMLNLCQKLKFEKFNLIGLSLGGGISATFSSKFPEMIERCVLVAPAGLMKNLPLTTNFFTFPIIGEIILNAIGKAVMASMMEKELKNSDEDNCRFDSKRAAQIINHQLYNHPGFPYALHSTLKNYEFSNLQSNFIKASNNLESNLLAIWGDRDKIVPFHYSTNKYKLSCPRSNLKVYEGLSHDILLEKPLLLADDISEFLNK
ncbi:hypothetical protein HK099_004237 [Clydaea vesicula]|uniref:AB hydrolase-1 domain-containing protein n=1 Tax=Clydaea vesicula TaxID=447962 RepID=A0AAD5XYB9_9FUNG|nr:hypothetical protein HK099_004237 [Clydaea vesicula]